MSRRDTEFATAWPLFAGAARASASNEGAAK